MTQLEYARRGETTEQMRMVSEEEGIDLEALRRAVAEGRVVVPHNQKHKGARTVGIGEGLRVKVNVNLGTSPKHINLDEEIEKLRVAVDAGADTVMDLSIGGDLDEIRLALLEASPVPLGTVPIYQTVVELGVERMKAEDLFRTIERHGEQGVDFITVHCGITRKAMPLARRRVEGIVSRGGGFLYRWMCITGRENPLYEGFDELLAIAREHDMTLSLGDALRPGCIEDATDEAQLVELRTLGELVLRAREAGVQVMVEGPGHIPMDQIERNIRLQKEWCRRAPFYVLGPIVTDVAPGYDHITGAIGGALAAYYGADFLCYVTPAEHLRLPTVEDVREGVVASVIAAHAADLAKGLAKAKERDLKMAQRRRALDWEGMFHLALDPQKARRYRQESDAPVDEECTMCGEYCVLKLMRKPEAA
ncbi:MAG TPA: phosphomethylpyrimidine synthase ThiC [Candidatus Latescibacteria bacterium]|nr:phosphomethylpyrimidine synthase ThiC [Candidatus Latescibacterota bacterium]